MVYSLHFTVEDPVDLKKQYWTPLERISDESWKDTFSGKLFSKNDLTWHPGQPNGEALQPCLLVVLETGKLHDDTCNSKNMFVCKWHDNVDFTLRGLCKNSNADRNYILIPEKHVNGQVSFYGLERNNIFQEKESQEWIIYTTNQNIESQNHIGLMTPDRSGNPLPIGLNLWNVSEPTCSGIRPMKLSLVMFSNFKKFLLKYKNVKVSAYYAPD